MTRCNARKVCVYIAGRWLLLSEMVALLAKRDEEPELAWSIDL